MKHSTHLSARESALLVIDVQEKLMTKIPGADGLIRNIAFAIDAAKLLEVDVAATEQYPKGLGPTVAPLAQRVPNRPDKLAFSSCAVPNLLDGFRARGRTKIVLVGRVLTAAVPDEIVLMHVGSNPGDHSTLDADS